MLSHSASGPCFRIEDVDEPTLVQPPPRGSSPCDHAELDLAEPTPPATNSLHQCEAGDAKPRRIGPLARLEIHRRTKPPPPP